MNIRSCEAKDVQQIVDIYNYYIENTVITFEETPLSASDMGQRVETYTKCYPWLVCEVNGCIAGYAYATKWRERTAYKNTLEITVYIKHSLTGNGYGKALFSALIESLKQTDCHVMLGCIALPNAASVGLHERFGFNKVAHFPEVGRKFDRWLDVGYWQKIIQT